MPEATAPVLDARGVNVFYGRSHALQGVDLSLQKGVLAVVGRNGMGKTTLCKAIMGLVPVDSGSISFRGTAVRGLDPAEIARLGVGYVPQGRRLWRSLTVDEHLRMVSRSGGPWSVDRIYSVFPRLAERKGNNGAQLSGGEQQMLAIGRALLLNPALLVMDEPTEGLAPMIVRQVEDMLVSLGEENDVNVLVIEQNIGVACSVSKQVAIMVNGRINRIIDASELAADRDLQQALLGVGRHAHDETPEAAAAKGDGIKTASAGPARIYLSNPTIPTRWSKSVPAKVIERSARTATELMGRPSAEVSFGAEQRKVDEAVFVAGTLDTKAEEIRFLRDVLEARGLRPKLIDLSTTGKVSGADVPPHEIAAFHPRGNSGVFTGDRGTAVAGMTLAFERWARQRGGIAGMIGAGGSGATAMIAPAMRSLRVGVPKVLVSTVASGNVGQYVGSSDILMLHSVADVQGLNSITREVLSNGAAALAGMVQARRERSEGRNGKPSIGLTMFGVTTQCVKQISERLAARFDCLVFHATGTGGRSMENLLDSRLLAGVVDVTTTEICDLIAGGVFAASEDRFGAAIRTGLPYVGAAGALDMVNFGAPDTVPSQYAARRFYEHNPQVTLMRTTREENEEMGRWIGERLNLMRGPVRFFLPEGGVSSLDRPGQPFWDPEADAAFFKSLEATVQANSERKVLRIPANINDPEFADAVVQEFNGLHVSVASRSVKE
ncbi:MAG: ABC transporter permease [Albidovulum sp.]|nr:ABC transporter permease [Albidovulum sp.]MDE0307305.1 ABC transporter permease [Albidovulum sp.]MDE0530878.1 ABC transporter permease [Albidovulum sp.]